MSKKNTNLILSRAHLSVVELHAVSRDAAATAAAREAAGLERALDLIIEAGALALAVSETTASEVVRMELRHASVSFTSARVHLQAAIATLRR